jgi:hypothetical protein
MINFAASLSASLTGYITSTSVFSNVTKSIITKDFAGGKINNLFGGTTLDFTHADIAGIAVVDISQAFGETIIVVPAGWRVEVDFSQLFTATNDKRTNKYQKSGTDKILVLTGVSVFASVTIVNA